MTVNTTVPAPLSGRYALIMISETRDADNKHWRWSNPITKLITTCSCLDSQVGPKYSRQICLVINFLSHQTVPSSQFLITTNTRLSFSSAKLFFSLKK